MKKSATIARYLIGAIFTIFGLNGFFNFIPMPVMPPMAEQFMGMLNLSHHIVPVLLLEIACGILFLVNRYIPLALILIAPVIVNILLFHILMNPSGIVPGLIVTACWFIVFSKTRTAFTTVLRNRTC